MFKSSVYGETTNNYTSFNTQYYNPIVCSFLLSTDSNCITFVTKAYKLNVCSRYASNCGFRYSGM